jgi:hypothetical protein
MRKLKQELERLKENKLIINYDILSSDECVGVEKDHTYIRIEHGLKDWDTPFPGEGYVVVTESTYCTNKENLEYETQLVTKTK